MPVDTTRVRDLADRLKRGTRNVELIEIADAVLELLRERAPVALAVVKESVRTDEGCPVCRARRDARTASQRRWRSKKAS